ATRLARLPGSRAGGVRARSCRMAGCATPTSSAGHAPAGAKTIPKLTFSPDHLTGADQENAFIESRNARLRDELLDGEVFYTPGRAALCHGGGMAGGKPSGDREHIRAC